jgi:hypothetical protein
MLEKRAKQRPVMLPYSTVVELEIDDDYALRSCRNVRIMRLCAGSSELWDLAECGLGLLSF